MKLEHSHIRKASLFTMHGLVDPRSYAEDPGKSYAEPLVKLTEWLGYRLRTIAFSLKLF